MPVALGLAVMGVWVLVTGWKGWSLAELFDDDRPDGRPFDAGAAFSTVGSTLQSSAASAADSVGALAAGIDTYNLATTGGAKGIVDNSVAIARQAGGSTVFVVSAARPGSTTSSGNASDHSSNDASRAARDIAKRGVDAIKGPPSRELDRACVAIGKAFGRNYRLGARVVDTFTWKGYRVQIIWRTPEYGGHMGHIHVGARKL